MHRRGLSSIVTNVLIILLIIVLIGLIAGFLFPFLRESTDESPIDCYTVKLEPVSCTTYTLDQTNVAEIIVGRKPGPSAVTGIEFLFQNSEGQITRVNHTTVPTSQYIEYHSVNPPAELETTQHIIAIGSESPLAVEVVARIGEETLCSPSVSIRCELDPPQFVCPDITGNGHVNFNDLLYLDPLQGFFPPGDLPTQSFIAIFDSRREQLDQSEDVGCMQRNKCCESTPYCVTTQGGTRVCPDVNEDGCLDGKDIQIVHISVGTCTSGLTQSVPAQECGLCITS